MQIRDFTLQDKPAVLNMVHTFYNSPGVLHSIPVENFEKAYDEMCMGGSNRVRGLLIEIENTAAGYCFLSFGYSAEAGGTVVFIEDLFMKDECRGHGAGAAVLNFLRNEYHGKAARLRLEVAPENTRAQELYKRMGFTVLPYIQMICEGF